MLLIIIQVKKQDKKTTGTHYSITYKMRTTMEIMANDL